MNDTSLLYTPAQQAMLPLTAALVVALVSSVMYYYARRHLQTIETSHSRMHMFYRTISATLAGQFIGHTNWNDAVFMSAFVGAGYFAMDFAEAVARVWNTNANFVALPDAQVPQDVGLNKDSMEAEDIIVIRDVTSPECARDIWMAQDDFKDTRKRQWMLASLMVLFVLLTQSGGLRLVYAAPTEEWRVALVIAAYVMHNASLSVSVFGAMVHAKFHVTEKKSVRLAWWISVTLIWALICIASSLWVLVGTQQSLALAIADHDAFVSFYGFASGVLLRLQQYFHSMGVASVEKRDILRGSVSFLVVLVLSITTSRFL